MLARKHQQYFALGNRVPPPPDPDAATAGIYLAKARDVRRYHGAHPTAAQATLARLNARFMRDFAKIDAGFEARRDSLARARASLRAVNETLRVELRRVERPLLFRAPSRAQ